LVNLGIGNNFLEVAVTSGGAVTLLDFNDLILGASKISGALNVTTRGELTQSGALAVKSATTTLTADNGFGTLYDITLDNAGNDFKSVVIVGGKNVTLRDLNAIAFGASTVSGDLSVQANLNSSNRLAISQVAATALTVAGSTTLEAGSRSTITLNNAGNELHGAGGSVSVAAGASAALRDATAINLGESTLSGDLTVTGGAGAAHAITQGGPLVVGKVTTLVAGAADITLGDADNDFGTLAVTSGDVVSVNDKSALILGASTVGGTLGVTTNGAITQSGALDVTGAATLSAGAANDIVLLNAVNDFSSIGVDSGRNVALRDTNALDLAASTVSGTLDVTADGITDSGTLDVAGKATLTAGTLNDIALDDLTNNLGEVAVISANNVTVNNSDALILAASTISGALDVTLGAGATGGLTQSGALTVAGIATLDTGVQDIELTNAANNFATVAVVLAENATLRDINAIVLGSAVDNLTVNADLAVTAGGAITDDGVLSVGGLTTLTTSALADITLDTAINFFADAVSVTSANNVALRAVGGMILGTSNISGALGVTLTGLGDLTQSGPITVAGTTTLAVTAANDVDLTNAANNFATVSVVSALDVSLADADDVVLGTATVSGDLSVTVNGSITDSGVVAVSLTTTLKADSDGDSAGDITLNSASSFTGKISVSGGVNVAIENTVATIFGDLYASGNLTLKGVTAGTTMTNFDGVSYGILNVPWGVATLDVGGTGTLNLRQTGWTYGSIFLNCGTLNNI
jgi:autotransporter-associated beta strand protein